MRRVVLVEKSATLRHLASRLLISNGYSVEVLDSFQAAHQLLCTSDFNSVSDLLLLGWPLDASNDTRQLISCLGSDKYADLPIIVMGMEAGPDKMDWVNRRPNTILLLWDDYRELVSTIRALSVKGVDTGRAELAEEHDEKGIRILFVDDSKTVRVSYKALLEKHGYHVDTAVDIADATDKVTSRQYDIAIIDYFLPDGTGDSLCREIRDNDDTAHITTAIITGTYVDKAIISSLDAGAVECMFKNEANELFMARINSMSRSVLERRSVVKDRERFEGILTSVGDGVYGVDREGVITFINPVAKKILGYRDTDVILGRSPVELFHKRAPTDSLLQSDLELCRAYRGEHEIVSLETLFVKKNGSAISVECTVYPLNIDDKIEGSVVAFRDITERKFLEEELKWQATHDPLTKLNNRQYFEDQLTREVERVRRSEEKSALLYLDLDQFKYLNDTAGHDAGDKLLIEVARKLQLRVRKSDVIARLGGDEFAIIMRNISDDRVMLAADSFRDALADYRFVYEGRTYVIHSSIGIDIISSTTRSAGEALANADIACYVAKNRGRNNCHLFDGNHDHKAAMDMELGWSARLRDALDNDRFVLHFQPILPVSEVNREKLDDVDEALWDDYLDCRDGGTLYYEALLRLEGSDGKLIYPDAFLPTAERFNMMREIDYWVIRNAVSLIARHKVQDSSIHLSVNLSGQTMDDEGLSGYISEQLEKYRVDPSSLTFEITESSAISNMASANRIIDALGGEGCSFALDDFGSGYCSLSHLKHIPVDYIKIDGAFVQGLLTDPIDMAIVNSVVRIAHSAGKFTVAEYVDNPEVMKVLMDCGVDFVQGYYISRPRSAIDGEESLLENLGYS